MKGLVIFVRLPVAGKVKARLASHVGLQAANNFYRACAEHTIVESARLEGITRFIYFADSETAEQVQQWMHSINQQQTLELRPQTSTSDPGQRMSDALKAVFDMGAGQAVLISSDAPDLSGEVISNAFKALETSDVVLGPAHDGGYCVIGLRTYRPSLFQGISWKTDKVLQQTVDAATAEHLKLSMLPGLYSIGTYTELQEWVELLGSRHSPLHPLACNLVQESAAMMDALAETGYTFS